MKLLIVLIGASLVSACANGFGYDPRFYYNEIQAVNLTGSKISDISLRVTGSPLEVDCAEAANFAMCADRFGKKAYPRQGLEVSWTHPDGSRKTDTSNPDIPAFYYAAFPLRIVLEINEDGSVKAFYEQDEPGRDGIFTLGKL